MSSFAEKVYFNSPVAAQSLLASLKGYQLYRKRYTGIYHELRALAEESRAWSDAERHAYQSEELHRMVKFCRHQVPYYQQLFSEYGLHENQVTDVSHIRKIPTLSKSTLRENIENIRSKTSNPYMIQQTSGSTGTPLVLGVDEQTYKLAMALLVDHEEYHGIPFGARRATFAGRMLQRPDDMTPPFSRYNEAENQRLYSSYHLNAETFPHYRADLERFKPIEIIGYPSAISDLAAHYERSGTQPHFSPTAVITNSETLLTWQRDRIERVFKCPVFDYYGTAEYVIFAGQDNQAQYRTNPLLGITEVQTQSPSQDSGPILATTLTNHYMPLLRYEVGDTATISKPQNESTTIASHLDSIEGRIDDYIETPDGRQIGRMDHIFKGITGIHEAQVIQDRIDHCTVRLVLQEHQNYTDEALLTDNFRQRTGNNVELKIEYVKEIPRSSNGKFKAVLSLTKN